MLVEGLVKGVYRVGAKPQRGCWLTTSVAPEIRAVVSKGRDFRLHVVSSAGFHLLIRT